MFSSKDNDVPIAPSPPSVAPRIPHKAFPVIFDAPSVPGIAPVAPPKAPLDDTPEVETSYDLIPDALLSPKCQLFIIWEIKARHISRRMSILCLNKVSLQQIAK
jgi:hypothetical protein